jgi:hypothetical protein
VKSYRVEPQILPTFELKLALDNVASREIPKSKVPSFKLKIALAKE